VGVRVEVCVDSVEGARVAAEAGADRIELCGALAEGGLTPSAGLLHTVLATTCIDTRVLIRPRGGDFVYDESEVQVMLRDIAVAAEAGAQGVVIGALNPDGDVDTVVMRRLVAGAAGLPVTVHRAFDLARQPHEALEAAIELGAERLLTSGQAPSALEGADLIAELVQAAGDRLVIMPGGGINDRTVARVLELTGVHEVHTSAGATVDGPARFRNPRVNLGGTGRSDEFSRRVTDRSILAAVLAAAKRD
jgi:copper homeostasis protein